MIELSSCLFPAPVNVNVNFMYDSHVFTERLTWVKELIVLGPFQNMDIIKLSSLLISLTNEGICFCLSVYLFLFLSAYLICLLGLAGYTRKGRLNSIFIFSVFHYPARWLESSSRVY